MAFDAQFYTINHSIVNVSVIKSYSSFIDDKHEKRNTCVNFFGCLLIIFCLFDSKIDEMKCISLSSVMMGDALRQKVYLFLDT